jgi:ArsR family transcriptional regulator
MESLSDVTRLRLLRLLERHELGVVELCDVVQLPQSTVSRHLKVLSDQGWVRSVRQGVANLYRMVLDELDSGARRLWLLAREQMAGWATVEQDELRLLQHLREKQKESQAFFAGTAGQWDKLRGELYGQRFINAAMLALIPSDWTVADLGCGTGQLAAELAEQVRQVIAVDNSAAMLEAARRRLSDVANVEVRRGDLESLPIEPGECDAAMMVLVLSYLAEPAGALREMARVLRPGGRAVIVDLLPHDRDDFRRRMGQQHAGFATSEIQRMLGDAGFGSIKVEAIGPETGVKGPALFLGAAVKL